MESDSTVMRQRYSGSFMELKHWLGVGDCGSSMAWRRHWQLSVTRLPAEYPITISRPC